MRAGPTSAIGSSGQSYVRALLEEHRWAVAPNPAEHDLGTDLWVSPRDRRGFELGLMLGIQVKNGESWFDEPGTVDDRAGWWFRDSRKHFDYWLNHAVPHVVVLRNPTTQRAYWVHVNKHSFSQTNKGGKVFVPEDQGLGVEALERLTDIAVSVRPRPRWSGSAWTGAPDLAPSDQLRHALLAPRLVAPHPNAGVRALGAHEAVALLTAGRFGELGRYDLLKKGVTRTGWAWDFFAALYGFASSGTLDSLRACAENATEPHERAASAAALAAALVEDGAHDKALHALDEALAADDSSPIDHAWLQVHRARSLAEIGDTATAVDLAVTAQALPTYFPDDVTAAAIAGSGAALVFSASEAFTGDVAATISAGDTETSWWRAQATSWGMGVLFDESFRRWDRSLNETRFTNDTSDFRLRGVSLVAGFTPLHDTWCSTVSVLAKAALMSGSLDVQEASGVLTDLRRAGDVKAIKAGVSHLLESGPAQAVRIAADEVDLGLCTRTDSRASIELIIRGADVLSTPNADAAARWAMQGEAELEPWLRRVRPGFIVEYQRAAVLKALVPVVSAQVLQEICDHVAALPPLSDQGAAHAWATVVATVPQTRWTVNEVANLLRRSGDHSEFEDAVRSLGVLHDGAVLDRNNERLRAGDLEALSSAGPITNVPANAAAPLIATAGRMIRDRLTQVRAGMYAQSSGVNPGRALVLLNVYFPGDAEWAPILELLSEPATHQGLLMDALGAIQWHADKVDRRVRDELADALAHVVARAPALNVPVLGGDPRPAAISALDALHPGAITPAQWADTRDAQGRRHLILALARRADPSDTGVLVALAGDPDPRIRAAVGAALSYWVVKDMSTTMALDALNHLLADHGTLVARNVVSSWPDEPNERVRPLAEALTSHLSARVRSAALDALGGSAPAVHDHQS